MRDGSQSDPLQQKQTDKSRGYDPRLQRFMGAGMFAAASRSYNDVGIVILASSCRISVNHYRRGCRAVIFCVSA